jgi:hypothetical protein
MMSYTKQQIATTARFIADSLFEPEQLKLKQWFCRQFKEGCKGLHLTDKIMFGANSSSFTAILRRLNELNMPVPSHFQVTLFNTGKSVCRCEGVENIICVKSAKKQAEPLESLGSLLKALNDERDEDPSSDDEMIEVQANKPLVWDFVKLSLASVPKVKSVGVVSEAKRALIC